MVITYWFEEEYGGYDYDIGDAKEGLASYFAEKINEERKAHGKTREIKWVDVYDAYEYNNMFDEFDASDYKDYLKDYYEEYARCDFYGDREGEY